MLRKKIVAKPHPAPSHAKSTPAAPPVYRPQPTPKVLQRKIAAGQPSRAPVQPRPPFQAQLHQPAIQRKTSPQWQSRTIQRMECARGMPPPEDPGDGGGKDPNEGWQLEPRARKQKGRDDRRRREEEERARELERQRNQRIYAVGCNTFEHERANLDRYRRGKVTEYRQPLSEEEIAAMRRRPEPLEKADWELIEWSRDARRGREALRRERVASAFGVSAIDFARSSSPTRYDVLEFRHPHTGDYGGDPGLDAASCLSMRRLMAGFFGNAAVKLVDEGTIIVVIKPHNYPWEGSRGAMSGRPVINLFQIAESNGWVCFKEEQDESQIATRNKGVAIDSDDPSIRYYFRPRRAPAPPVRRAMSPGFPRSSSSSSVAVPPLRLPSPSGPPLSSSSSSAVPPLRPPAPPDPPSGSSSSSSSDEPFRASSSPAPVPRVAASPPPVRRQASPPSGDGGEWIEVSRGRRGRGGRGSGRGGRGGRGGGGGGGGGGFPRR